LIHLADIALYYAKSLGKNCYFVYDENNKNLKQSSKNIESNNQLLNQTQLFELILDETQNGILITDAESYKIIYANNIFKKNFNIALNQNILGEKCFEVLYDYTGPCSNCSFHNCLNLEFSPFIHKGKKLTNKTRMIEWNERTAYIKFFYEI